MESFQSPQSDGLTQACHLYTKSLFTDFWRQGSEVIRNKEFKYSVFNLFVKNTEYEDNKAVKNPKYKDRAGKRRETIGSEGTFQRGDTPASVHM